MPEEGRTLYELGAYLRSRREEKGISTKDVSVKLHIRERYIVAIEEGDIEQFPALVYARGFIRNYLSFLREADLWEEYHAVLPGTQEQEDAPAVHSLSSAPKGFRRVAVGWLYIFLVLLVAGGGFFLWMQRGLIFEALHRDPKPTPAEKVISGEFAENLSAEFVETPEVAALPETASPLPTVKPTAKPPSPAPSPLPATPAPAQVSGAADLAQITLVPLSSETSEEARKDYPWLYEAGEASSETAAAEETRELVLSASGACWVRVAQGEKVLFVGTLKKGETRNFPLEKALAVRVGNAGVLSVRWLGKSRDSLGKTGEVKTLIFDPQGGLRDS
ncbi:MAG TPA: DUF4115 domain-containing protein [Synergistaceae bacterium]|nr:DUF4115 domain-containing protein [Synergistaceae bacterium]